MYKIIFQRLLLGVKDLRGVVAGDDEALFRALTTERGSALSSG